MSRRGLARHAARRDANEVEIRRRFTFHGWHTEQVSGKGLPDLLAFSVRTHASGMQFEPRTHLVDVKTPKGTLKPAQAKKWTALHALGIPVYVVRTEADVDALVGGTLAPWEPTASTPAVRVVKTRHIAREAATKNMRPRRKVDFNEAMAERIATENYAPPRKGDAAKARNEGSKRLGMGHAIHTQEERRCERCKKVIPEWRAGMCSDCDNHYTPPRSTPVDAAKPEHALDVMARRLGARHVRNVRTLGAEVMAEMLKPPGNENYDAALKRAVDAAKEAEAFAPEQEKDDWRGW